MNLPPYETPARDRCAFCGFRLGNRPGKRGRSNEHVISDWIRELIPGAEERVRHQRWTAAGDEQMWTAVGLDMTVNRVCKVCNSGWMNDLDHDAGRFLAGMIQGRRRELHKDSQPLIAAWATKTALALYLVMSNGERPWCAA